MRKSTVIASTLVLASAVYYWISHTQSEPEFQPDDGFVLLYDEESLTGWSQIGGQATFEADGDEIVGRVGPGGNTFLRTDKVYRDFTLKLQMRWQELGNSGVMFRAAQREEAGGELGKTYGYQYELDASDRAWSGGIYDEARRGWLATLEDNEPARNAIRLKDWNDVRIEARGASINTWINDVPAASIIDGLDFEGFIALQVHAGDEGIMRWRRIQIAEHPIQGQPGEAMDSPNDWRTENIADLNLTETELSGVFSSTKPRLVARRQLDDALVKMTVAACEQPSRVRLRHTAGEGHGESYVQVSVYEDRAQVSWSTRERQEQFDAVDIDPANRQQLTVVSVGNQIVVTVGEQDVARLDDIALQPRGQLVIEPAPCADSFSIADFSWLDLKAKSTEVLFYQTLDTQPAPVFTPEQSLADFKVAPGFEVELVAAEPLIEDPVAMAWDEFGRLYVVEMRGYMPDAYGTGRDEPVGQVVRLEDVDGDGRMDSSEVFLGELVNPRAVAVVNEGILIGEPPNLWLCELASANSLCSHKKRVGDYAPDSADASVEHLENGLRQGLDNWLYNSKSSRKLRLKGDKLEEEENLFRGQWGISHDVYGRWFYNHNSTWLQADLFAAEDIVTPRRSDSFAGLGQNLTELSEVFSVRVNPGVNRAYLPDTLREDGRLHKATGVSGLVSYRGDQFPQGYRNHVFVPEVAANVVAQIAVKGQGMELAAEHLLYDDPKWGQREFLASTDERFRPVDAMNGPDGALYIIDMYRGIAQDQHFLTDELREQIFQRQLDKPLGHGRIWRVRHTAGRADRAIPDLAGASDSQLIAHLSDPNGWVRDTAQRLLLERKGPLRAPLNAIAGGENTLAAIHALWTLHGRGELTAKTVLSTLQIDDPRRQQQALRAGRQLLSVEQLLDIADTLEAASELLQMQLAFALGDHSQATTARSRLLGILQQHSNSDYVRQAVLRAVQGVELEFLVETLASEKLNEPEAATKRLLASLAANAYQTLRGDLTSDAAANPQLEPLLTLAQARQGDLAWQQIAMLEGFHTLTMTSSFLPAKLTSVPAIFSDASVSESDPLWPARLAGRAAFTWPGDELAAGVIPLSPEQLGLLAKGESLYPQCGACHGANGAGTAALAPALANSPWVLGPPEWLGRIILQGMQGPVEIDGEIWNGLMPPHGQMTHMDDENLAGLMTYLRRSWGHKADPVSREMVASIRESSKDRTTPWTVAELETVAYDRGFSRFTGKYSVSFLTVTISEEKDGLHMTIPMYGGGVLTQRSATEFETESEGESVRLEFIIEDSGAVNEFIMHREGQKIPVKRARD